MHTKFWSDNLKGRDCLEDLGIGRWIILEYIFDTQGRKFWNRFIWLRIWTSVGPM